MRLPYAGRAWIPPEKLSEYLLSTTHPVGSPKAAFFRNFGFTDQNMEMLENGLLHIAWTDDVVETERTSYGVKYVVEGELETTR